MKSMKLYAEVHRIHRELAALGIDEEQPLAVAQLTPFDQYHYFGTEAVDEAIHALALKPGARVLDVGAGLGGPARYLAERCGVHVTALELQEDLHDVAVSLTERCGLSRLVEHRCGNVLDGVEAGHFDAIISFLCILHIPDRERLFSVLRQGLREGGRMYIEDFVAPRAHSAAEAEALRVKVQCPSLPSAQGYVDDLARAGFSDVAVTDVSESWKDFTASRLEMFRSRLHRNERLHGKDLTEGLDDFYATVAGLFQVGAVGGVKILAG